jgi:hypothetical protein
LDRQVGTTSLRITAEETRTILKETQITSSLKKGKPDSQKLRENLVRGHSLGLRKII